MSIRPRGNGYIVDFVFDGKRVRKTCKTYAIAAAWEASARSRLFNCQPLPDVNRTSNTEVMTLKELKDRTYKSRWSHLQSGDTALLNAEDVVRTIGEKTPIKEINEEVIEDMIDSMKARKRKIQPSTINRKLAALSGMLTLADRRGWIPRKPYIRRENEAGRSRIRWVTDKEEKKLIKAFDDLEKDAMTDLVVWLIDTGCRCGEAFSTRFKDIKEGVLHVFQSKTQSWKHIPLTKRCRDIYDRLVFDQDENNRIFGDQFTYWSFHTAWKHAKEKIGLAGDDEFVPHALRHTFCSRLVQKGVPIQVVKELAGHSSIAMTMRYAHLAPNNLLEAISVLEE